MTLLYVLAAHMHLLAPDSALYKPQVRVVEQKADIEAGTQPPHMRATLTFENKLNVPAIRIRMGLLIAENQQAYVGIANPWAIYETGPGSFAVRPVEKDLPINIPANATVTANVPIELPTDLKAGTFLTHVLGYTLGDVSVDTLLFLLNSTSAADQLAACEAMGLTADPNARQAARQRWGSKPHLRADFQAVLDAPAPESATQADTFARIYSILALGVLGGSDALHALRQLQKSHDLTAFDGPMEVLQRARQEGSPRRTPLAFAIPANAQHFSEVVDAAVREADGQGGAGSMVPPQLAVAALVAGAVAVAVTLVRRTRRLGQGPQASSHQP